MGVFWIKYRGTRFPVRRGETILGRSPYSSIVISNSLVSREHCALRLTSDGLQIIDLESTNGTTVNGEKISGARKLVAGDVLGVGTDFLEVIEVAPGGRDDDSTRRGTDQQAVARYLGDPDTQTTRVNLELVEALVVSASESHQHKAILPPIRRAVDELLESTAGRRLDERSRARLEQVLDRVCEWYDDGSMDEWRSTCLKRARGESS